MKKKLTADEYRKIGDDFSRLGMGSIFVPPHKDDDSMVERIFNMFGKGKNGNGGKYEKTN